MEMLRSLIHHQHGDPAAQSQGNYATAEASIFDGLTQIGTVGLILSGLLHWALPQNATLANMIFGLGLLLLVPKVLLSLIIHYIGGARLVVRDQIVKTIPWRGDEQVLDVGTGSGIMLIGCAQQLTTGKGVGIDIFQINAGGGTAGLFLDNIAVEGVADRVELQQVDARQMPFETEAFDVIVSSLALHHIGENAREREQAIQEMLRVLKPGGYIALYDIAAVIDSCLRTLQQSGISDVQKQGRVFKLAIARKTA